MKLLHALMVCLMLGISSAGDAKDDPKEIPQSTIGGKPMKEPTVHHGCIKVNRTCMSTLKSG